MNNKSEIFDFYMSCNGKLKKKEEWLYLSENFEEKRGKIEKFKKKVYESDLEDSSCHFIRLIFNGSFLIFCL